MAKLRKKFWQQILLFNRAVFIIAAGVIIACIISLCIFSVPGLLKWSLLFIMITAVWFSAGSLFFSYLIYDRSDLYRFGWLKPFLLPRRKLFNIYSGYSDAGHMLNETFPDVRIKHFDFFDPKVTVTASIKKAKVLSMPLHSIPVYVDHFGTDEKAAVILFMQSLHELRTKALKISMLNTCIEQLEPEGKIIIAEHFCDGKNFLIYGPGAFHFFGRLHWQRVIKAAGLITERKFNVTPFINIYILKTK